MSKPASPCIGVCKFKRAGHCIGCSMTKDQKSLFKTLRKDKHRRAFVALLIDQQLRMGRYLHWAPAYLRRCAKKKTRPLISPDRLRGANP